MPRRRVTNEADAANLLADCMAKLVRSRGDNISGNDLHALNSAVEMFMYAREVDRVVQGRNRTLQATGLDPVELEIERHQTMRRLRRAVEADTGIAIPVNLPARPTPTAKPRPFKQAERNLSRDATIKTGLPPRRNKQGTLKLKPKPKRTGKNGAKRRTE